MMISQKEDQDDLFSFGDEDGEFASVHALVSPSSAVCSLELVLTFFSFLKTF